MKVLPRIKAITGESSSAIAAVQQRGQGSVIMRTGRFFKGASRYPKGKKRFG
jgi:hypothetical protein